MIMFSWVDYVLIGIIALSVIVSILRGFVREALSLASWIAAFWVAMTFSGDIAHILVSYVSTPSVRTIIAFIGLFLVTLIVCGLLGHFIAIMIQKTGLSGTDRLLGIVFGFCRGVLLVALLLLAASYTAIPQDSWWQQSVLIPHFMPVTNWIKQYLPNSLENPF